MEELRLLYRMLDCARSVPESGYEITFGDGWWLSLVPRRATVITQ
jgi:hypothetical protein